MCGGEGEAALPLELAFSSVSHPCLPQGAEWCEMGGTCLKGGSCAPTLSLWCSPLHVTHRTGKKLG